MKIAPNTPSHGAELERLNSQARHAPASGPEGAPSGEDTATLSTGQTTLLQLQAQLRTGPPDAARSERVAQLRSALANGTYNVKPAQVAQAMIADLSGRQD